MRLFSLLSSEEARWFVETGLEFDTPFRPSKIGAQELRAALRSVAERTGEPFKSVYIRAIQTATLNSSLTDPPASNREQFGRDMAKKLREMALSLKFSKTAALWEDWFKVAFSQVEPAWTAPTEADAILPNAWWSGEFLDSFAVLTMRQLASPECGGEGGSKLVCDSVLKRWEPLIRDKSGRLFVPSIAFVLSAASASNISVPRCWYTAFQEATGAEFRNFSIEGQ